jgi:hypothetical protein
MERDGSDGHGGPERSDVRVRPARLDAGVAWLFMAGSACFVVGSVPAFVRAVGGWADGVTYVVGSVLFTSAAAGQLLQAQTPAMTDVDAVSQHVPTPVRWVAWRPHDRGWWAAVTQLPGTLLFNVSTSAALVHNATAAESDRYVWRPDLYGSTLFLVASTFGVLAVGGPWTLPWRIAWLDMVGSVLFMASALASYVLPSGDLVDTRVAVGGTLLGALCFLVAAAWMLPAWRRAVRPAPDPSTAQVTARGPTPPRPLEGP